MAAPDLDKYKVYESLVSESMRAYLNWDKIAVREKIFPGEVMNEALGQKVSHICQTSHPYFVEDLNVAAVMLGCPDIFRQNPVSSILNTASTDFRQLDQKIIFEFEFNAAKQKSQTLQGVENALIKKSVPASIVSDAVIVADELFTNAVFNAPFVDLENTLPGASREDQNVKMHDGKFAKLFMGADTSRLVIGCVDMYGTLNMMKLFSRIQKCYNNGVSESMNMSSGGAGIGSFMVYNAAASYFSVVEERVSTMICCALPIKMSNRARLALPKNLHYILKK